MNEKEIDKFFYKIAPLLWGGIPIDKQWAKSTVIFNEELEKYKALKVEIKKFDYE